MRVRPLTVAHHTECLVVFFLVPRPGTTFSETAFSRTRSCCNIPHTPIQSPIFSPYPHPISRHPWVERGSTLLRSNKALGWTSWAFRQNDPHPLIGAYDGGTAAFAQPFWKRAF